MKVLVESKFAEASLTTQYTAARRDANSAKKAERVEIQQFSVAPPASSSATLSVYLVPYGGTAGASNLFLTKAMTAGDPTYTCPELIGHVLEPGDFIATNATAATLPIRVCGEPESVTT